MPNRAARVLIASDHAGFELKEALKRVLREYEWDDLGPRSAERVDYPDFAETLARRIAAGDALQGVLICGSGIGMCIAANKITGIRAAVVESVTSARLSREHNDANVLCLGARFLAHEYAAEIAKTWLDTPFSADARHQKRIDKIMALEKKKG
jgi:ribose 5-phosphate isomerase B